MIRVPGFLARAQLQGVGRLILMRGTQQDPTRGQAASWGIAGGPLALSFLPGVESSLPGWGSLSLAPQARPSLHTKEGKGSACSHTAAQLLWGGDRPTPPQVSIGLYGVFVLSVHLRQCPSCPFCIPPGTGAPCLKILSCQDDPSLYPEEGHSLELPPVHQRLGGRATPGWDGWKFHVTPCKPGTLGQALSTL